MKREYPEAPIVGVGAVVLDGNRVLLVQRGQEPLKGEWSLPGGVLELGETLEVGIRREVLEETGLDVEVSQIVEVLERILFDPSSGLEVRRVQYHYVLIDYLCFPTGGMLRSASDAQDVRWIYREELNSHSIYRLAPVTAAVIEKAFQLAAAIFHQ